MDSFTLVGAVYFDGNYPVMKKYDYNQEIRFRFDEFVAIGDTVDCRNCNLWCHRWWKGCRTGDVLFSLMAMLNMWFCMRILYQDVINDLSYKRRETPVCIFVAREKKRKVT